VRGGGATSVSGYVGGLFCMIGVAHLPLQANANPRFRFGCRGSDQPRTLAARARSGSETGSRRDARNTHSSTICPPS